jgi:hypothetical protein
VVSNRLIQTFGVLINSIIFGYEKECILWVKNIDKTIKEQDLFKKASILGDIFVYTKQLEGAAAIFVLFVAILRYSLTLPPPGVSYSLIKSFGALFSMILNIS